MKMTAVPKVLHSKKAEGGKDTDRRPLYERTDQILSKQNKLLAERKLQSRLKEEKELEECTFRPQVNPGRKAAPGAKEDNVARLYKWQKEKELKLAESVLKEESSRSKLGCRHSGKKLSTKAIEETADRMYRRQLELKRLKEKEREQVPMSACQLKTRAKREFTSEGVVHRSSSQLRVREKMPVEARRLDFEDEALMDGQAGLAQMIVKNLQPLKEQFKPNQRLISLNNRSSSLTNIC